MLNIEIISIFGLPAIGLLAYIIWVIVRPSVICRVPKETRRRHPRPR